MSSDFKVRGLPEHIVEQIDRQAREAGMSREAYLRWLATSAAELQTGDVRVIRLTEPLPCGKLTGSGVCGKPAQVATLWPGPVPGQWTMLPMCEEDARRMVVLYKLLEDV